MQQNDANPRNWSVECIIEWLKVREQEGKSFPATVQEFVIELDHSALFRRLVEGKPALPTPPPLSFSSPWYQLIENGEARPYEVWEMADKLGKAVTGENAMVINQHKWKIIEKVSNDEFVVTYDDTSQWRLWVETMGSSEDGQASKQWKLKKIE